MSFFKSSRYLPVLWSVFRSDLEKECRSYSRAPGQGDKNSLCLFLSVRPQNQPCCLRAACVFRTFNPLGVFQDVRGEVSKL